MKRDVATLQAMGFSQVQAQKALFLWAGVHYEAVNWLVMMQGAPDLEIPWNLTQLQVRGSWEKRERLNVTS